MSILSHILSVAGGSIVGVLVMSIVSVGRETPKPFAATRPMLRHPGPLEMHDETGQPIEPVKSIMRLVDEAIAAGKRQVLDPESQGMADMACAIIAVEAAVRSALEQNVPPAQVTFYGPPEVDGPMACVCDHSDAPAASMCIRCPRRQSAVERDLKCWAAVMELRSEEAESVTLLADNVDFNSMKDRAVTCSGDWTSFEDERFEGDSLLGALETAVESKRSRA
jgi:hypothetical protein